MFINPTTNISEETYQDVADLAFVEWLNDEFTTKTYDKEYENAFICDYFAVIDFTVEGEYVS